METVLAGLNRSVCLDYLHDIIVTGATFPEHLARATRSRALTETTEMLLCNEGI